MIEPRWDSLFPRPRNLRNPWYPNRRRGAARRGCRVFLFFLLLDHLVESDADFLEHFVLDDEIPVAEPKMKVLDRSSALLQKTIVFLELPLILLFNPLPLANNLSKLQFLSPSFFSPASSCLASASSFFASSFASASSFFSAFS